MTATFGWLSLTCRAIVVAVLIPPVHARAGPSWRGLALSLSRARCVDRLSETLWSLFWFNNCGSFGLFASFDCFKWAKSASRPARSKFAGSGRPQLPRQLLGARINLDSHGQRRESQSGSSEQYPANSSPALPLKPPPNDIPTIQWLGLRKLWRRGHKSNYC